MINHKKFIFLTLLCLTLMAGCSTLSSRMEDYRNSYHGLKVNDYKMGSGGYGVMGITSLKMDGYETLQSICDIGGEKYNPTPKPFNPGWFASSANIIFNFPHTIEVTWFIYEEQQFYHTNIIMPSYKVIQKTLGDCATSTIGLGIIPDMPPQIKCFIFDSTPYMPYKPKTYYLAGTGMGTPIPPIPAFSDELAFYTRFYCEKGILSDRVCEPYRAPATAAPSPDTPRRASSQKLEDNL